MVLLATLASCGETPWNDPYPLAERGQNIRYSAFGERPKHLDPARSYNANEIEFIGQVYEPPLQYHYLKRPYELIPATATEVPRPQYFDAEGKALPDDAPVAHIVSSVYEIHIQPGIRYQPHPAFARDARGQYRYHAMSPAEIERVSTFDDFKETGTRELVAEDYVFQIKRLASPKLNSPIFGMMSEYIAGLKEYADALAIEAKKNGKGAYLDLNRLPLAGVEVVDRYTYRVKLKGKYPQFVYWLAMPFFAPVPWEAERFYNQPGMKEKNLVLDWFPVGTGPYMLTVNNPNKLMVLARNPNFHGERYPDAGEADDRARGLLNDAGKTLPFIDKAIFSLEKEDIPYWNKFLQGFYDSSGLSSDTFDQAIRVGASGEAGLTEDLRSKDLRLETTVMATISYMGFNMQDPVIGGLSERAIKLRQAISIAVDYEERISIFSNGRGIPAQGPLPPGIFGYYEGERGINPAVYDWAQGTPQRKSIETAKRLLAEAGYPNGRDARTGQALVLNFDTAAVGPDQKSRLDWLVKQFKKLDLDLVIRATDYNRFQEKMLKGTAQIFEWGWNADYPDPENFLFLLYGPNKKVGANGENAANYDNPAFNRLFEQMKNMDNGAARQKIIDEMVGIARHDAPWVWGYYPKSYGLYHAWLSNAKPNLMANNGLKYLRVDPALREQQRMAWNKPRLWPIGILVLVLALLLVPAWVSYRRKLHSAPRGRED